MKSEQADKFWVNGGTMNDNPLKWYDQIWVQPQTFNMTMGLENSQIHPALVFLKEQREHKALRCTSIEMKHKLLFAYFHTAAFNLFHWYI